MSWAWCELEVREEDGASIGWLKRRPITIAADFAIPVQRQAIVGENVHWYGWSRSCR
jgi:hypothetical protein